MLVKGGLCLSSDGWELPLNLRACGNSSTWQNFTYDDATRQFRTLAPAPITHRNYEEQYAARRVCQSSSLNSSCEHDVCTACDPGAVLT